MAVTQLETAPAARGAVLRRGRCGDARRTALAGAGVHAGAKFGTCTVIGVARMEDGAIGVSLSGTDGRRFELEILGHDARTPGVARAGSLSVYVNNRGRGDTRTEEEHGLAAMALAAHLARRETAGESLPALPTLAERSRRRAHRVSRPEVPREFELQLGHLCNDRCVFCESGRLTHARQAPILATEMLEERVREAHAAGHRRITLLGGEPTLQPSFIPLVELAVSARLRETRHLLERIEGRSSTTSSIASSRPGGTFEWRFSVQGATRDAHERTTGRKGGFDQVLRALSIVRARGQRATVNLCLVQQNCATVDRFAELLVPLGVSQVHVDMLNPYDTGSRSEDEIAAMMPRYTDVAPALDRMVRGSPRAST